MELQTIFQKILINYPQQKSLEISIMDADLDAPLSSLTVRDLAAILLQKPVSNKKWLNDLIK